MTQADHTMGSPHVNTLVTQINACTIKHLPVFKMMPQSEAGTSTSPFCGQNSRNTEDE
jgi:hypothetical protein